MAEQLVPLVACPAVGPLVVALAVGVLSGKPPPSMRDQALSTMATDSQVPNIAADCH
jgi:hypothetical protein